MQFDSKMADTRQEVVACDVNGWYGRFKGSKGMKKIYNNYTHSKTTSTSEESFLSFAGLSNNCPHTEPTAFYKPLICLPCGICNHQEERELV